MNADNIIKYRQEDHEENTISTDYKAEVVAAELVEKDYDEDRILIVRKGANHRSVAKDIEEIETQFSQQELIDYLYIKTNRDSIYDSLPEGLFHDVAKASKRNSKEDIINEIRRHRAEENYARQFFRPLEISLDQTLVFIQLYERMFDKKNVNRKFVNVFLQYWPIIKILPLRQAVLFMKTIPIIKDINNDFNKISQVMSIILGYNVKVEQGKTNIIEKRGDDGILPLGECVLDESLVIGKVFNDGYNNVQITIGPVAAHDMEYFTPNANGNKILYFLIDMIIPCDRYTTIKYNIKEEDSRFVVSNNREEMSYLGISTYI